MAFEAANLLLALWSIIAFVLLLLELQQMEGNLLPFAIGGVGGAVAWAMGLDFPLQVAVFAAVSAVAFLVVRPLFRRKLARSATSHMKGLDLLVGLEGTVISKIGGEETGRVEINGRPAKAVPVDPQQQYNIGDKIVVTALEGDTLVVKKSKR